MKCTIKIHMDNAAFGDGNGRELARILHSLAGWVDGFDFRDDARGIPLFDANGNTVGKVMFSA